MVLHGRLSTPPNIEGEIYRGVGGGSTVSITPVYESGTKIADYEIDGSEGAIFIPNYPVIDDFSDMEWTKLIEQQGGAFSQYIDVSEYKYICFYFSFNNVSYIPYFYKVADLQKLIAVSNNNQIGIGYQWILGGNNDYFGFYFRNDNKVSIASTYSGVISFLWGIK